MRRVRLAALLLVPGVLAAGVVGLPVAEEDGGESEKAAAARRDPEEVQCETFADTLMRSANFWSAKRIYDFPIDQRIKNIFDFSKIILFFARPLFSGMAWGTTRTSCGPTAGSRTRSTPASPTPRRPTSRRPWTSTTGSSRAASSGSRGPAGRYYMGTAAAFFFILRQKKLSVGICRWEKLPEALCVWERPQLPSSYCGEANDARNPD